MLLNASSSFLLARLEFFVSQFWSVFLFSALGTNLDLHPGLKLAPYPGVKMAPSDTILYFSPLPFFLEVRKGCAFILKWSKFTSSKG
jgi:hypothetical protein